MEKTRNMNKFKQGAASFYMIAITTLVLVIIATSFAAVIIAEIARTSNDDLAQSAYDAAMAGVEDARLAYYNYSNCVEKGGSGCEQYLGTSNECNSFVDALGRVAKENGEVKIQESSDNNMDQAYTCVKISKPNNFIGVLDEDSPTKIIKVELGEGESAEDIKSVKLSWKKVSGERGLPTLEIGLIQTATTGDFNISNFETTKSGQTNRGTVFLDSVFNEETANESDTTDWFLKSNDKVASNKRHEIECDENNEYQCTVDIKLPEAVGGGRNDDTFMFTWSMLGKDTDGVELKMELCTNDEGCYEQTTSEDGTVVSEKGGTANLDMQIAVDATGRANDLYRRVEVRLGKPNTADPNKIYAVSVGSIKKIEKAICENDFVEPSNCSK